MSSNPPYDPWVHAKQLGLQVLERPITTAHGLWLPDYFTIVLKDSMAPWAKRAALAHEIGHALCGHTESTPANEAEANHRAVWNMTRSLPRGFPLTREALGCTTAMLADFLAMRVPPISGQVA